MPFYYAVCHIPDQDITEREISSFFTHEKDRFFTGIYSGYRLFDSISIGFFVTSKAKFKKIYNRLHEEGIYFLDEDEGLIEVNDD